MSGLTPFEEFKYAVQNQIDYMVSKFQESYSKYEESEKVNQRLIKENESLRSAIQTLNSKYDMMGIDFGNLLKSQSSYINMQDSKTQNLEKSLLDTSEIVCSLKNNLSNTLNEVVKSKDNIRITVSILEDLTKKTNGYDEKHSALANIVANFEAPISQCKDEISKINSSIVELKNAYNNLSLLSAGLGTEISGLSKDYNVFCGRNKESIEKLQANFTEFMNVVPKMIDSKISDIPIPIIPSLDEAKKTFQNQLEPVSLDAKNANLRAVNNESKIFVMEKRVEQLQLLLNKYQLQE